MITRILRSAPTPRPLMLGGSAAVYAAWALLAAGCPQEKDDTGAGGTDSNGGGEATDTAPAPSGSSTGTTAGTDASTTGFGPVPGFTTGDTGDLPPSSFIVEPDGGQSMFQCNQWAQDCPEGQKCNAFASSGASWNATKCFDIEAEPKAPGDACTVQGERHSGIDNCDKSSMCWDVDKETLQGSCAPYCTGGPDNPGCEDPDTTCSLLNDGAVTLCIQICDPLAQDCPDGSGCYLVPSNRPQCIANRTKPGLGDAGSICEFNNHCNPGFVCLSAASTPGCMGSGCCTPWCDRMDKDYKCPTEGQVCTVPPGYENQPGLESYGVCSVEEG